MRLWLGSLEGKSLGVVLGNSDGAKDSLGAADGTVDGGSLTVGIILIVGSLEG